MSAAPQAQRRQWHQRENVLGNLPAGPQVTWRRKLQATYEQPTYAQAKRALSRSPAPSGRRFIVRPSFCRALMPPSHRTRQRQRRQGATTAHQGSRTREPHF